MSAIDDLISDLLGARYSSQDQNIICKVDTMVAALQYIQAGLLPPPGDLTLAANAFLIWTGRSKIGSSADGVLNLLNNAGTGFRRLNLGGTSASFPGLQRNGAALQAELADGSALANFICKQLQPSPTDGILGTTTNDNAPAGAWEEYAEAESALTNFGASGVAQDLITKDLTAGDWDVWGAARISSTGAISLIQAGISTTANTLPASPRYASLTAAIIGLVNIPAPMQRFSLSATTTLRLVGLCTSAGTGNFIGGIYARRRR